MATTAPHSRAGLPSELTGLLPVLLDEISRLKRLHSLAGITELPVKDAVVRQELALLRSDFAQIKSFFSGAAGAMMTAGTNQAQATEAAASKNEDAKSSPAFGQVAQSAEFLPATRPRMNSVNVSGMLALPDGCDTHFFLSHFQATGSDQVATLELELQRLGFRSWYDNKASDLTRAGMKDGVSKTGCFLLFLSRGVMERPYVQFELRTAIELGKRIVLVHETEGAHGRFDFTSEKAAAPDDLRRVLDDYESVAYRRRDHERNAMLMKVIGSVPGYGELLESAKEQASTLAAIPPEVYHWEGVEAFQEREAHATVKQALLDAQSSSAQCVVAYGMGGTGKTVCAVDVCQDVNIRAQFSRLAWVSIGQEALIEELQETMMKQIADKSMPQGEEAVTQHGRLKLLQDAVAAVKGRMLVVLDDPWQTEQVRYLNPLDPATPSKLLVTTRIRGLVKGAVEVPLELLRIEDSAAMLMEIGQVDEVEYRTQNPGTDFPPQAALRIASECGNLPLMLTLAGKMIRQWGSLWADIDRGKGVLSVLQKDNLGLMRKRANSAKQFSHTLSEKIGSTLEQRIISAGLDSIRGDDAAFVKDVFYCLAVTVEDLMHDSSVIELLWTSCGDPELVEAIEEGEVAMKVRTWIGELLSRSLLLGNAAGVHLHDIMLGFLRSRLDKQGMLQQQRKAVSGILAWVDSQDEVKVTGNTLQASVGEHLDWYLNRALAHHMQHALDLKHLPLTDDAEAQQWCSHDETLVRAAVLHAVGREDFVRIAQWLSDVKGEHYHASTMLFTLATDASVFDSLERGALLLQSSELFSKATEAQGLAETKERLQFEYDLNEKLFAVLEVGSSAWKEHMERNVDIASHRLFADDPEKKAGSLLLLAVDKMGWAPANPSPSPQDLREGCQLIGELANAWHQVADLCAEQSGEGGAKEQVYRVLAGGWLASVTAHWPDDYKTVVLQTARSRQLLVDSVAVLDFERHSPGFRMFGMGFDLFSFVPICEDLLEVFGDTDSAVEVLQKQQLFVEQCYKTGGRTLETLGGTMISGGIARNLGMSEALWAHFERMDMVDDDTVRACFEQAQANGWRSDDGLRTLHSPDCYRHMHLYLAGLIAPEGTFELDALLSDCPEPESTLLDDNTILTMFSFPARLYLGELLERAGMHEQALAQVQPAIVFSPCNPRLKIKAWLLLGRCHVAMGHKHHAHAVIDDAVKEAQRTEQLLSAYQAAAHMLKYVLEPAPGADEATAQGREQLAAARAQLTGPAELLDRLGLGAC